MGTALSGFVSSRRSRPSWQSSSASGFTTCAPLSYYTAYALAIFNTKRDPPPREATIQFPICESEPSFRSNEGRINPLAEKHRRWIEALQPYAYDAVPGQTAMYWVNHLARIDRHRKLQVVGGYITESSPIVSLGGNEGAIFFEEVDS